VAYLNSCAQCYVFVIENKFPICDDKLLSTKQNYFLILFKNTLLIAILFLVHLQPSEWIKTSSSELENVIKTMTTVRFFSILVK